MARPVDPIAEQLTRMSRDIDTARRNVSELAGEVKAAEKELMRVTGMRSLGTAKKRLAEMEGELASAREQLEEEVEGLSNEFYDNPE